MPATWRTTDLCRILSKLVERVVQTRLQSFLTVVAWCQQHSLLTDSSTAPRRRWHACTMTSFRRPTAVKYQFSAYLICPRPSTRSTTSCPPYVWNTRGAVLQWFRSYLSSRTYQVLYSGGMSSVVCIPCSVPQGSVLGPINQSINQSIRL